MISTRVAAALVTGSLAFGILAGSAGTIVVREGTAVPQGVELAAETGGMMNGSGGMMNGSGGMMNGSGGMMNGSGGMMNGSGGTGPAASTMPDSMQDHHVASSPVPTR